MTKQIEIGPNSEHPAKGITESLEQASIIPYLNIALGVSGFALIVALGMKQIVPQAKSGLAQGPDCPQPDLTLSNLTKTIPNENVLAGRHIIQLRRLASCTGFVIERIGPISNGKIGIWFSRAEGPIQAQGGAPSMEGNFNALDFNPILRYLKRNLGQTRFSYQTRPAVVKDALGDDYDSKILSGLLIEVDMNDQINPAVAGRNP